MNTLVLNILLLFHFSVATPDLYPFSIQGQIDGLETGTFAILSMDGQELLSTGITQGKFKLNGKLKEPGQYLIQAGQSKLYCFLDGRKMTLNGSYNKLRSSDLEGSPANDLYIEYYKMIAEKLEDTISTVLNEYKVALGQGDSNLADLKINAVLRLEEQRYDITKKFVEAHKDNIFSAYISDVVKDASYENGKQLYSILTKKVQKSYFGRQLNEHVRQLRISALGVVSPDFNARSEGDQMVSLSSQRGKIVVLDFWASWCGPCIQEMRYLKKLYGSLKKENIQFISISLDDSAEKWKKACQKEQIPWVSLHEEKGWERSEIRKLYGIQTIPFVVLLDERGRIIAKNLRRDALHDKIQELLKK